MNTYHITDFDRLRFLEALVVQAKDLTLTEWESRFVGSFIRETRGSTRWITPGRGRSVDVLWNKYGAAIGQPIPLAPARRVVGTDCEADPAGCMYLVTDEATHRQRRCNAPATLQRGNGFRYCAEHGAVARKATCGKLQLLPLGPREMVITNSRAAGKTPVPTPDWRAELDKLKASLALPDIATPRN